MIKRKIERNLLNLKKLPIKTIIYRITWAIEVNTLLQTTLRGERVGESDGGGRRSVESSREVKDENRSGRVKFHNPN